MSLNRGYINHEKTVNQIQNNGASQYTNLPGQKPIGEDSCKVNLGKPKCLKDSYKKFTKGLSQNCYFFAGATLIAEMLAMAMFLFIGGAAIAQVVSAPVQFFAGSLALSFGLIAGLVAFSPWFVHMNPTVSIMLFFFEDKDTRSAMFLIARIIGQFLGGFLGMGILAILFGQYPLQFDKVATVVNPLGLAPGFTNGEALVAEIVGGFILHLVVLIVTVVGSNKLAPFGFKEALVIGFTFLGLEMATWRISGGAFNWVRWIAAGAVTDNFGTSGWWIYLLAPAVSALAAGLVFLGLMYLKNVNSYDKIAARYSEVRK